MGCIGDWQLGCGGACWRAWNAWPPPGDMALFTISLPEMWERGALAAVSFLAEAWLGLGLL